MKNSNIRVRPGTIADIDTIVEFNMSMARETEDINLQRERLRDGVTEVFEDSARGFYILAECDGRIVGQTMITYEWSDWRNAVFWWVQSVYVLPAYRRLGIFRTIFENIKLMAEEAANVCGFRLYVDKDNHLAKQAYRRLGMNSSHYELYEIEIP